MLFKSSFIDQIFVQSNILCVAACKKNPNCRTATYNKLDHSCLMYTEFSTLGQLISNKNTITFGSQVPHSCANWVSENNINYRFGDIAELDGLTLTACRQWCNLTVNCVGISYVFSYSPVECWIKKTIDFSNVYNDANKLVYYCY
ncbi:unnamed protein product [Adineta steineri]|uniref:Apple domain-containing protein n=1 Tax=Adineta steineri TaxID=433720 RepID=A0A820AYZ1_9BILA|nr:unnamed protein product [Adineta steineri]